MNHHHKRIGDCYGALRDYIRGSVADGYVHPDLEGELCRLVGDIAIIQSMYRRRHKAGTLNPAAVAREINNAMN
jgi:hypothetical protein